jgi:hypothetical protein
MRGLIANYEKILDAKLMKRQLSGLPGAALSVDPPSGINSDHIKILRERYISAGWKDVKIVHDQREGSGLEFIS